MEKYKTIVSVIESAQFKLKEEALSYMLVKLRLPYEIFKLALNYHLENKESQRAVSQLLLDLFKEDENEFKETFYSREQMLMVTERIAKVGHEVIAKYGKDEGATELVQ